MTILWILLWIAIGAAAIASFLAALDPDGRTADLLVRWYDVRYADTSLIAALAAAKLAILVLAYTGAGAISLVSRALTAAASAADAGVARTTPPDISDKESE